MPGTIGHKIQSGEKKINIDGKDIYVKIRVFSMSFSAHADSKGIMDLLQQLEPKNIMLVHGEKEKMKVLANHIKETMKVPCHFPPNHSITKIATQPTIKFTFSQNLITTEQMR